MSYKKDGKTYYTIDEAKKNIDEYIHQTADELVLELREKRNSKSFTTKEKIYV